MWSSHTMEFNGIIQQLKKKRKERSSDPGCNMDEPWRYCPERNTWDTERQGLYDSLTTVRYPKCCCYCLVTRSCPTCNSVDRLPCPSLSLGVCSNSCPLSQWCHPTISSSVIPLSSRLQSFQASESFHMTQFFASDGQSIGVSVSASVLPMNIQDWFMLGWTGWISLQSKGLSTIFYNTAVQKHQFFGAQLSSQSNSHVHTWPLEKP